jgi:hypothetical protein
VGAEVTVRDYAGPHADDTPHEFYFPKGDGETILALVRGLAHFCGPFLVLNDLVECTLVAADTEPGSWLPLANLDA